MSSIRSGALFCSLLYAQPLEHGRSSTETIERIGRIRLLSKDEDSLAQHEGSGKIRDNFCSKMYLSCL